MDQPSPIDNHSSGPPPVNVIRTKSSGPPKKLLLIATLSILILGIVVAVYLVKSQQLFGVGACDCSLYNFYVDSEGNVTVVNGQSISEEAQTATVTINGSPVTVMDVPALSPGQTASIGSIQVPDTGTFSWTITGSAFCSDSGSQTAPTPTPTPIPSPTPTEGVTPTPSPTDTPEPTTSPSPTVTIPPTSTPSPTSTPIPTSTPLPTSTPRPTATPGPADPTPGPLNICNGTCGSDANCGYAEDGSRMVCSAGRCRHGSCSSQESCHCPPVIAQSPSPTPTQQLPQTGGLFSTTIVSLGGILLIGLGLLLAL